MHLYALRLYGCCIVWPALDLPADKGVGITKGAF